MASSNASGKIVNMSIAGFIFASVGASALVQIANVNTSGMDASTVILVGVITIAFVLGIIILFLREAGIKVN
ncbi:hypothetical protein RE474_13815 (plasmid) [Methanolobus sediminis]|uniref:Uncharacterized protein n=1 Tax=Methanolobus sediminis TaxID=3072978 RepID=A0AA51UMW4_9EURY|nr:hypothetical protein [Methanolobus sediminis]WMW26481.1 hypothetical protein RE474_13815 [Methanolobus sediminis]